jgi:hypothetical protein
MKKRQIIDAVQNDLKLEYLSQLSALCKTKKQEQLLESVFKKQTHPSCLYDLFGIKEPK